MPVIWNGEEISHEQARAGLATFALVIAETRETIASLERSKRKGDPERLRAMREKLARRIKIHDDLAAAIEAAGRPRFRTELTAAGEQYVIPGAELNASPKTRQLKLF